MQAELFECKQDYVYIYLYIRFQTHTQLKITVLFINNKLKPNNYLSSNTEQKK